MILLYLLINLAYMAQLPLVGNPAAADAFGRGISGAQSDLVAAATMQVMWGPTGAALTARLVMVLDAGMSQRIDPGQRAVHVRDGS